ncbi:PREDICTED: uncharacterized protein LOC109583780 [Amphimedon queenslandica]|uniref:Death domain-containing protein n=2 Tax=Amphimedon queenslandica TaxID=400682 RepID=A0AAN0JDM0_AMPQE|nr:PREDICTED: uncharacterized protein LOC109583780 [Amphimedon queenslandica]|eukprot:XP_019854803.1 PREDICTED: uncharacterized protein LOC109583780 [Amphimedon queenslandica]
MAHKSSFLPSFLRMPLPVPDPHLTIADPTKNQLSSIPELLQLLGRHGYFGANYYILGFYLGLSSPTLDVIAKNNKGDNESCLRECLTKWLEKADDVQETRGGPTIYSLISALRELGENEVAEGIDMEKHPACRILSCYTSDQTLVSALPQLAIYLYDADLIQKMIVPRHMPRESLLGEIKAAVCADYKKLKAFAGILCKYKVTVGIGRAIKKDCREVYESDDDKNGLQIYLPKSVTSEFKKMRLKFWQTFIKVESIMKSNPESPSLYDMKHVLGTYNKTLWPQLAQCKGISDILQLIRANSSLDDISMLEYFVNEYTIEEAKVVVEECKGAVEDLKIKLCQFLEEELLKASSLKSKCVMIVIDEDIDNSVLKDVQRLSSGVLPYHVKLKVIRDDGSMWEVWEQESFSDTFDDPIVLSKDITATTKEITGTTESVSHSYQEEEEEEDTKDEHQVMLLQEKVQSIQKQLEEEKELHEKETKILEQVIKKYEKQILQLKGDFIQNKGTIATLTEQQEEISEDLKHKTEQYEELRSDNELTYKQLEELEKKLKREIQTSSCFMKQKEVALREKEELQIKIFDLQQELELQQAKDHKEVLVQCEYTITQSEQGPVQQKEEYGILQENVSTSNYISKGNISQLSVIMAPVEDDWYYIGQCLEVKESVLTEIKEMTPVDSRLTHVLETWCHEKDRTITELKESLKRIDRDDILEGLHELPTGQYTMNNDEEYDINVKDSNDEVETQIETENKEIQTTQTTLDKEIQFNSLVSSHRTIE